jgi:hypothetical protein
MVTRGAFISADRHLDFLAVRTREENAMSAARSCGRAAHKLEKLDFFR